MSPLDSDLGFVIRTDFSDQAAWETVVARVTEGDSASHGGIGEDEDPLQDFIDDEQFAGLTAEQARLLAVGSIHREAVFLADSTTMGAADRMLLAVAGHQEDELPVWRFRVKPESVPRLVLMLSTKHSFDDYVEDLDDDGVYSY